MRKDVCRRGDCLRLACGELVEGREYSAWGICWFTTLSVDIS